MTRLTLVLVALLGAAWMWWLREDPFVKRFDIEQYRHVDYYSPDIYG